jgi:hypothetical protein
MGQQSRIMVNEECSFHGRCTAMFQGGVGERQSRKARRVGLLEAQRCARARSSRGAGKARRLPRQYAMGMRLSGLPMRNDQAVAVFHQAMRDRLGMNLGKAMMLIPSPFSGCFSAVL